MSDTGMTVIDTHGDPDPPRFTPGPAWRARHARPLPDAAEMGRALVARLRDAASIDLYLAQARAAAAAELARDLAQDARRAGL